MKLLMENWRGFLNEDETYKKVYNKIVDKFLEEVHLPDNIRPEKVLQLVIPQVYSDYMRRMKNEIYDILFGDYVLADEVLDAKKSIEKTLYEKLEQIFKTKELVLTIKHDNDYYKAQSGVTGVFADHDYVFGRTPKGYIDWEWNKERLNPSIEDAMKFNVLQKLSGVTYNNFHVDYTKLELDGIHYKIDFVNPLSKQEFAELLKS